MQRDWIEILVRRYFTSKSNERYERIECEQKCFKRYIPNCPFIQIINVKDPNWWQAKHVGNDEAIGLIPSIELEERRKAFVPPEADYVHTISICGTRVNIMAT